MPLYNEWILKKFKSYSYLFNKFYKNDIAAFSLITARNNNIELVKLTSSLTLKCLKMIQ